MTVAINLQLKAEDLTHLADVAADMAVDKIFAALTSRATAKAVPAIGQIWPGQGGYNGGLMRGIDGGRDYYLIFAAEEHELKAQFGSRGKEIETSVNDGLANTKLMLKGLGDFPAAQACASLAVDGHNDFYLGARREMRLLSVTVPELFNQSNYYWTSTQCSDGDACYQDFSDGHQSYDVKINELRVRPVRRLFI